MSSLRDELIRLAHREPELRAPIVAFLRTASKKLDLASKGDAIRKRVREAERKAWEDGLKNIKRDLVSAFKSWGYKVDEKATFLSPDRDGGLEGSVAFSDEKATTPGTVIRGRLQVDREVREILGRGVGGSLNRDARSNWVFTVDWA